MPLKATQGGQAGPVQPLRLGNLNVSSWSPDGQKIALTQVETTTPSTLSYNFYVIQVDGRQFTSLLLARFQVTWTESEVWTRDSRQLLYALSLDAQQANFDFYLVSADGRQVSQLTHTLGYKQFVA